MKKRARQHSAWSSPVVKHHMDELLRAAEAHDIEQYRTVMHTLGSDLGKELAPRLPSTGEIIVACTVEDADFLGRGVLDEIEPKHAVRVFCYWNARDAERDTAPILSRYEEPVHEASVSAVVVIKSIISGACVVRTNLVEVLEKLHHDVPVFVLAPAMHKDSAKKLSSEFPASVSKRFQYITCAVDAEKAGDIIHPGIGGSVYELLGLGDKHEKNRFRPRLVADRARLVASGH